MKHTGTCTLSLGMAAIVLRYYGVNHFYSRRNLAMQKEYKIRQDEFTSDAVSHTLALKLTGAYS